MARSLAQITIPGRRSSNDWDFYFAKVNDAVASIFVAPGLRADAPNEQRPGVNGSALLALAAGLVFASAAAAAPIMSRAELDTWLVQHTSGSPLDALTPGARERFLLSLTFGAGGIDGLDASDLMDELSDAQIHEVLELFGPRALEVAPPSHHLETRRVEKHVREPGRIGAIEATYNRFYAEVRGIDREATDLTRAALAAHSFDTRLAMLFETAALRRTDDHELRLLRAAARRIALQTVAPRHVDAFRAVFVERARRNMVSSDDAVTLRNLYLAAHRLPDARDIARDYPLAQIAPLPKFVDQIPSGNHAPTLWRLDADGKHLRREAVDVAPARIFVTAACHLSKDAAVQIGADPVLGPVFAKHAVWLVAAPGIESVEDAIEWNRANPEAPVAMIFDRAEWGILADWRMPQFHVVRDGREIETLSGWDGADSRAALIALLRRHGFVPDAK